MGDLEDAIDHDIVDQTGERRAAATAPMPVRTPTPSAIEAEGEAGPDSPLVARAGGQGFGRKAVASAVADDICRLLLRDLAFQWLRAPSTADDLATSAVEPLNEFQIRALGQPSEARFLPASRSVATVRRRRAQPGTARAEVGGRTA